MMKAAQYGHVVKHLETHHLEAVPIIEIDSDARFEFEQVVQSILVKRDRAYELTLQAEGKYSEVFGEIEALDIGEGGFVRRASHVFGTARRRLDAWHYNPSVPVTMEHLAKAAKSWSSVQELGFDVWLPTRFRRIPADDGIELLDSSDLFEINPDINKRIADRDFGDSWKGRVQQGWILLSRSGQIYGLNGSAMIAGQCHEEKIVSDHIIRIAPRKPTCRIGYLLVALTHPKLGRPRVKALPYGSSIPEIEVDDVQRFVIPRIDAGVEGEIADLAEEAARLRDEADELETEIGRRAEAILRDFLSHKSA